MSVHAPLPLAVWTGHLVLSLGWFSGGIEKQAWFYRKPGPRLLAQHFPCSPMS